jgi:pyridoxine 5-phosphate synthase
MIDLHAGHGLTLDCLREIQRYGIFSEYNIGHAIIADAVFLGLAETIKRYLVAAS